MSASLQFIFLNTIFIPLPPGDYFKLVYLNHKVYVHNSLNEGEGECIGMPYSSSWSQAWSHLTQYLVPNSVNTYLQYIYVCILAASHNPIGIGNHSYNEAG